MVDSPRCEFFTTDYTDCTDFFIFSREFALFAVDLGSTMRNPKEPSFFISFERPQVLDEVRLQRGGIRLLVLIQESLQSFPKAR